MKFTYTWAENSISIASLNSTEDEVYVTFPDYKDPNEVTSSNPNGEVSWIDFNFLTLDLNCEIPSQTRKMLVKFILRHNLYVDGALNTDNVNALISKFGTRYSDNRPNGAVTVIINN